MCNILLSELLKGRTYPEAGEVFYKKIIDCLKEKDNVIVDMNGVMSLPSMFLNMSIGLFIENFGYDKLSGRITFKNISVAEVKRLKEYIERTKKSCEK